MNMIRTHPSRVFKPADLNLLFLGLLIAGLIALCGCSVSKQPKGTEKDLVSEEAPVFDKRFKEMKAKDLNIKKFWVDAALAGEERDSVPIHNYTFSDITDAVKDGVVNIYTLRLEEREVKFGLSPNDILPIRIPLVSSLLDIVPFKVPIPFRTQGLSLGSGFIINEQGYILTNAHVIHNAVEIRVVLSEGKKEYPAKIIGRDALTDTALLKIEPDHLLTVLPLGDSDALKTGELVLAIGNPLGLRHTVTSGIISAKERIAPNQNDKYVDFLQTDSAINPGSSGGPLMNLHGEVVGINTAIIQKAQLIGFAVPIETVKEVMPMLVLGHSERGWFGAQAAPLTIRDAVQLDYDGEEGILVTGVDRGSPAEKSGLKKNDIIVKMNGDTISNFVIFRRKLLGLTPGKQLHLTIARNGKALKIESVLVKKENGREPEEPINNDPPGKHPTVFE